MRGKRPGRSLVTVTGGAGDYFSAARTEERGMPMQEVSTTGQRLVQGVLEHRLATVIYQGERRTVEPHLVGIHEAGEPILVAYQTAGVSHSGEVPGWRTFITTEIQGVELLDRHFDGPRPGFDPGSYALVELFARA